MTPQTPHRKLSFKDNLKQQKWLTLIGIPILLVATFNGIYSIWGVLFVYWSITSIMGGQAFLLETIERQRDPALFWIISVMWMGFGLFYILVDFFPALWSWG